MSGSLAGSSVPLVRLGEWYSSLDTAPAPAPGLPELSMAPEILVRSDARRLRSRAAVPVPDRASRVEILSRALELYLRGDVEVGAEVGAEVQSPEDFKTLMWQAAGLSEVLVDRWSGMLVDELAGLHQQAASQEPDAADGVRIGLVWLPGNTFTCLIAVLETALSGAAVWVRPSTREPYSALRLVSAMLQAGWPRELVGFYPCAQSVLRPLIAVTDRQIVYGGADVCAALRDVPSAVLRGPLRVCAVVPQNADAESAAAWLAPLIASDSGRFCTAVRAVLCLGEPDTIAKALASRLDAIPFAPSDPDLPLAAFPRRDRAAALAASVEGMLGAGDIRLTARPVLGSHDGTAFLAPTLFLLEGREDAAWDDPALMGYEAPFPVASVLAVTSQQAETLTAGADVVHRMPAADSWSVR
ncbi:hypothetical protein ABH926_007293 [Catenulispora sp. GP43]|uniref:aldehyde dehydrogenase family protein n=1 Tax=Catenulispora sp. GP43 TaxID=3156263 RepID=UPI003515E18B